MTDALARIEQHLTEVASAIATELDSIPDPMDRQDAAREVVQALIPALTQGVKAHRARTVAGLREGRTLAQVGQMLGGLSVARVDQILKGK